MKKAILILAIASVLLVSVGVIVVAVKPSPIVVDFNQAQYQWMANSEYGAWSSYRYQNLETSTEFTKTGNALHTSWDFSPYAGESKGESTVYVFNKKYSYWIQKEGGVTYSYEPVFCDYTANNFFRGYLDFGEEDPSTESFDHGVGYQWIYFYAPEDDAGVKTCFKFAQWDEEMGAWLVGFNLYLWDEDVQNYNKPPFPDLLGEVKPIPAKEFNPLEF